MIEKKTSHGNCNSIENWILLLKFIYFMISIAKMFCRRLNIVDCVVRGIRWVIYFAPVITNMLYYIHPSFHLTISLNLISYSPFNPSIIMFLCQSPNLFKVAICVKLHTPFSDCFCSVGENCVTRRPTRRFWNFSNFKSDCSTRLLCRLAEGCHWTSHLFCDIRLFWSHFIHFGRLCDVPSSKNLLLPFSRRNLLRSGWVVFIFYRSFYCFLLFYA